MVKRADHIAMRREFEARLAKIRTDLAEARALRQPALIAETPPAPPPPPTSQPYEIQVPLAKDLWVRLQATRPLEQKHWDRLCGLLDLQREINFAPTFAPLIEEGIGVANA